MTVGNISLRLVDLSTYCELVTESIHQHVSNRDFDSALVQLSAFLIEAYNRYVSGGIDIDLWNSTVDFYSKMVTLIISESNQYNHNNKTESEEETL